MSFEDRFTESIHYSSCQSHPSSDLAYTRFIDINVTSKLDEIMYNFYFISSAKNLLVWSILHLFFLSFDVRFLGLYYFAHLLHGVCARPVWEYNLVTWSPHLKCDFIQVKKVHWKFTNAVTSAILLRSAAVRLYTCHRSLRSQ